MPRGRTINTGHLDNNLYFEIYGILIFFVPTDRVWNSVVCYGSGPHINIL